MERGKCMERGKLIVFEGIDGSGKTTQCQKLAEHLGSKGKKVWLTRECTDGPIGQLIHRYLQKELVGDERLVNMLYAADRLDHITKPDGILAHLEAGDYVITDRYYLSSMAYWTYEVALISDKFDQKLHEIMDWNHYSMKLAKPDLTIFLSVPVDTVVERLGKRKEDPSIYEEYTKLVFIDTAYQQAIQYLRKMNDEEIVILNGDAPPGIITTNLCTVMDIYLSHWKGETQA